MIKVLVLAITLIFPGLSYADSPKDKDAVLLDSRTSDTVSKHEMMESVKAEMGYWKREDCLKVSEAAGMLLYYAGELLKESDTLRKIGKTKASEKSFEGAYGVSEVAANFAKNFEAFCK